MDVRFCQRWFAKPGRVIDLGCGTGRLAKPMTEMGHEYVGVDLSEEMLSRVPLSPEGEGGKSGPTKATSSMPPHFPPGRSTTPRACSAPWA
jgi:SAM-dependent methyltransferase